MALPGPKGAVSAAEALRLYRTLTVGSGLFALIYYFIMIIILELLSQLAAPVMDADGATTLSGKHSSPLVPLHSTRQTDDARTALVNARRLRAP